MSGSHRDRAASRAAEYRRQIQDAQAAQDFRRATDLALQWLRGELSKVRRRRPQDSPGVDADVTEKLAALAEAVPFHRPKKREGR